MITIGYSPERFIVNTSPIKPVVSVNYLNRAISASIPLTATEGETFFRITTAESVVTDVQFETNLIETGKWATLNVPITEDGFVTYPGTPGIQRFILNSLKGKWMYEANFTSTGGVVQKEWLNFINGSLSQFIENEQNNLRESYGTPSPIVNLNQFSQSLSIFNTGDRQTTNYNTGLWCFDVDFSFYSVFRTGGGAPGSRATLVAPDIVLLAGHYQSNKEQDFPATFTFRSKNGGLWTGTVEFSSYKFIFGTGDIAIGKLSSPAPAHINPCEVLPALSALDPFFGTFIQQQKIHFRDVPAAVLTQDYKCVPVIARGINSFKTRQDGWQGLGFNGQGVWVGGDSSSPMGFLFEGKFVVSGLAWFPETTSTISRNIHLINQTMFELGSLYQLTHPALTGSFVTFS